MEVNYLKSVQQGWQCPLCSRIYGPYVQECYYCNTRETNLTSITFPEVPEGVTAPTPTSKKPYKVTIHSSYVGRDI